MGDLVLAIDQGTTSSRAMIFAPDLTVRASAQREFRQIFPRPGWVEHDPEDIWDSVVSTCREALERAGAQPADIASIGLTNQRETVVIWDRKSGKPIHNAIVWQDRRTAERCRILSSQGHEAAVSQRTGLLLDPYFSATKIGWLLDHVDGARQAAERGDLAFGTVDSFLLWRLTGGRLHATDATNASRTLLYDLGSGAFDQTMLDLFQVPKAMLPEIRDSSGNLGMTDPALFGGEIRICGMAGDQQAATIGQACFKPGMMKATFGTGCFALLVTGDTPVISQNRLLSTVAWQIDGRRNFALEGAIFVAGATVQWLRDGLGIVKNAEDTFALAQNADPDGRIYLVPAFTGLGAPYWDPDCRGAIYGLTRGTGAAEFAQAALEAVAYQTRDLVSAMQSDWAASTRPVLRVDGGMSANDWAMQFLADMLDAPVDRPTIRETTALGAAYLAGRSSGIYPDFDGFGDLWQSERQFRPDMPATAREALYAGWKDAVARTLTRHEGSEGRL